MGFLETLFGRKSESVNIAQDMDKYSELICFVSFAKKTKALTGGNYGMYISYDAPGQNEHTSCLYATLGFYDFEEIRFARECAIDSSIDSVKMIRYYYKKISEKAGLNQRDWPYGIDEYGFADVLTGNYYKSYFTLIPHKNNDDIFTFRVVGGIDSRNAVHVSNAVINLLKTQFPELQILDNFATRYSMGLKIQI